MNCAVFEISAVKTVLAVKSLLNVERLRAYIREGNAEGSLYDLTFTSLEVAPVAPQTVSLNASIAISFQFVPLR